MPQDRNFEGGGRPSSHKSLGRRARDLGLVIVMAPNIMATGLPVVSGVQEAFMQPNAIVWVSSTNFGENRLIQQSSQIMDYGRCGVEPVISAEQLSDGSNRDYFKQPFFWDGTPTEIKISNGNDNLSDGLFISTDGGKNFTYVSNINGVGGINTFDAHALWSPHTVNGKHDLFIATHKEGDKESIALLYSPDGCQWNIASELEVKGSPSMYKIVWSEDGSTAKMEVLIDYDNYSGKYSYPEIITLSLNGSATSQIIDPPQPNILDQIANNDTLKIIASVAGALILIYFFARISVGAQDDDWFS